MKINKLIKAMLPACLCLSMIVGCGKDIKPSSSMDSETTKSASQAETTVVSEIGSSESTADQTTQLTSKDFVNTKTQPKKTDAAIPKEGILQNNALYKIESKYTNHVLASDKFGLSANAFVVSQSYSNDLNQMWRAKFQSDGSYLFENMSTKQYMTLKKGSSANGTIICVSERNDRNQAQNWFIEKSSNSEFFIVSAVTGKPIELKDNSAQVGAQIVQNDKSKQKGQLWNFTKVSDGKSTYPHMLIVSGAVTGSSCPEIIREGDTYYAFNMGGGIGIKKSTDMRFWDKIGSVFPSSYPYSWMQQEVPGGKIWAPGVYKIGNLYYLYYCISLSGKQTSAIGVAVNSTLDRDSAKYNWVDKGMVIRSFAGDDYNCIDPNIIIDEKGVPWLVFGSYWGGIKMRKIDAKTGMLDTSDTTTYSLANRTERPGGIEAPYIIKRGDYYYLFVAIGNFATKYYGGVGRSKSLFGPYYSKEGKPMMEGGHTPVTDYKDGITKVGHNSVFKDNDGKFYLVSEYFWGDSGSMMCISTIEWDKSGWPVTALSPDVLKSLGE